MKFYILFILSVYSMNIQAQTYEGKIGKYPIFLDVDLDYEDNRATAFYFYKSHLKNIALEGNSNESELILFEQFSNQKDKKELFTLTLKEDEITGVWQNNGQTLNVDLTKTKKNLDEYKLANLAFVRDSITIHENKELVWFTEKHSKKVLFRLGNGFTQEAREFMNAKLDTIHTENAKIGLDCGWADFNIEMELVSDQYISFTEYSSVYCGGAHPSHNTVGYNFDLKNKLQLYKLTAIYPHLDHYELLKKKYGNDTDLEPECEYFTDYSERFEYYSWVLTRSGVTITPLYPHAMTPCETGFPLTYEELQEY